MKISDILLITLGKLINFSIKLLSLGRGSTWPGNIVFNLNKNFIKNVLSKNPNLKVVLITGTNGKTTTSTLLKFLLKKNGLKIFQNKEGANLLNGIASSIIKNSNFLGKLNFDAALFEVDENALPSAVIQTSPQSVVILNLFRDQLDRYGEVDIIARKWRESLKKLTQKTTVFLNADDPQICYLGAGLVAKVITFGLSQNYLNKGELPHDVDSIYCPKCGNRLTYKGISYSHLGDYFCSDCKFERKCDEVLEKNRLKSSLHGLYSLYNVFAAVLAANYVFNISLIDLKKYLPKFKPVFGRQESVNLNGKKIFLVLAKNPTGFNQSISVVSKKIKKKKDNLLIVLNDRIPDGLDVSWIWDADFENLPPPKRLFISGDRAYDMALRLKYAGFDRFEVGGNLRKTVNKAVSETKERATLYVLPTYSAMLDIRKVILGRKLL